MKKTAIAAALVSALGLSLTTTVPAAMAAADNPNIVLIYVDDLGYGDLGAYGHSVVKTPNIDQLASEGVRYTQYYAPAPLCSPSRAGMLTGRTPYRTGIRSWIPAGQDVHIGENEITLAHLLKDYGYDTAMMGKLHLNGGVDMADHPQVDDLGFEYSFILPGGFAKNSEIATPREDRQIRQGKFYPDNFYRNGEAVGRTTDFSGGLVSGEVVNWLDKRKSDNPFFLYIAYSEVHTPLSSPEEYLAMYSDYMTESAKKVPYVFNEDFHKLPYRGPGEYYANITYLDTQVGRVMDKLEAMGEDDNTIVIFASDNGPVTRDTRKPWELNMAGETNGLKGRKDLLTEGGIRVPAIIKYPGMIRGGQVSDEPVTALDFMPTLSEMIGFDLPTDRSLDGQSMTATFSGKSVKRVRPFIWSIDNGENEWAMRDGDWKLIMNPDEEAVALYNIKDDRFEAFNQLTARKDILHRMLPMMKQYIHEINNDPLLLERQKS